MTDPLELEFLGTGGSFGIPEIGCDCPACSSPDPRDQRLRCAVRVTCGPTTVAVDTPPDFRIQCLRARIRRIDAVLYTHFHADHVMGADDLRRFNKLQGSPLPVFLDSHTESRFRDIFDYAIDKEHPAHLIRPKFQLCPVHTSPFTIGAIAVQPVTVMHGTLPIRGYIFRAAGGGPRIAYLTDCRSLPAETMAAVAGCEILILSALWRNWNHDSHLNVEQAVALGAELGCRRLLLTHITHHLGPVAAVNDLPAGVTIAWDGLIVQA